MGTHYLPCGTRLQLGMRVKDYNCDFGVVTDSPANAALLEKHEHTNNRTCNAWLTIKLENGGYSYMDCSRMISAPAPTDSYMDEALPDAMQLLENEAAIYAKALGDIEKLRDEYQMCDIDRAGVIVRINDIHSVTCAG